ncbi:Hypothetical predicted protein [Octopus vulgaris]|uniref:Uncharacterized protein n=1 Tax=Octopus vulgaris TaxID=6645 RepID=A0AA36F878_OCTVU|nr:Hypothetical predicted protein [Octopus vulgaris]
MNKMENNNSDNCVKNNNDDDDIKINNNNSSSSNSNTMNLSRASSFSKAISNWTISSVGDLKNKALKYKSDIMKPGVACLAVRAIGLRPFCNSALFFVEHRLCFT